MTQSDQQSLGATIIIAKQTCQRLARVGAVVPAMYSIIESTVNSGDFDQFDTLGLAAPDNAPGVSTTSGSLTGTYAYYVTMWDDDRSVEGSESAQSASISPSGQGVTVDLSTITNEASVPRATHFRIYRNLNGGSTYFYVTQVTVATASYADDNSDASISANDTLELDNDVPAVDTYGFGFAHKGYHFMAGPYNPLGGTDFDDDFIWSKLNNPDAYPTVNRTKVERGRYGHLRGMGNVGDTLIFFKDRAIYELHFNTDPSGVTGDGFGKVMNTERGALNHGCIANDQGTLYVMDTKGIYAFRGGQQVIEMALPLKAYWARINWAQREKFSSVVADEAVYFFVALDGETECKYAFVLDLQAIYAERGPRWFVHKYDQGIRDAVRINTSNETAATEFGFEYRPFAAFITEYGFTGVLGVGFRDSVDPQLTATGTVTSSTTTTLTDTGATFTRTTEAGVTADVTGCYVRFLTEPASTDKPTSDDWSQPYRITTTNSTTQITVDPAMPSAPAAGTVFVIGAIPDAKLYSPVMNFGRAEAGKKIGEVILEYQPLGVSANLGVGAKLDRRGIEELDATVTASRWSSTDGGTYKQIAMGGAIDTAGGLGVGRASIAARGCRLYQLVLNGTGVDSPFVIDGMTIYLIDVEEIDGE